LRAAGRVEVECEQAAPLHALGLVVARAELLQQGVHVHPFGVAGHALDLWLHGRKGLQRAEVGGRFHQDAAAAVDQHLGHEVQALLAAGGDEHLRRVHRPGQAGRDPLAQRAVAFAGGVLQCAAAVFTQHAVAGFAHGFDGEGVGRGQATGKADDARALGELEQLADHRGVHARGAAREGPGGGRRR